MLQRALHHGIFLLLMFIGICNAQERKVASKEELLAALFKDADPLLVSSPMMLQDPTCSFEDAIRFRIAAHSLFTFRSVPFMPNNTECSLSAPEALATVNAWMRDIPRTAWENPQSLTQLLEPIKKTYEKIIDDMGSQPQQENVKKRYQQILLYATMKAHTNLVCFCEAKLLPTMIFTSSTRNSAEQIIQKQYPQGNNDSSHFFALVSFNDKIQSRLTAAQYALNIVTSMHRLLSSANQTDEKLFDVCTTSASEGNLFVVFLEKLCKKTRRELKHAEKKYLATMDESLESQQLLHKDVEELTLATADKEALAKALAEAKNNFNIGMQHQEFLERFPTATPRMKTFIAQFCASWDKTILLIENLTKKITTDHRAILRQKAHKRISTMQNKRSSHVPNKKSPLILHLPFTEEVLWTTDEVMKPILKNGVGVVITVLNRDLSLFRDNDEVPVQRVYCHSKGEPISYNHAKKLLSVDSLWINKNNKRKNIHWNQQHQDIALYQRHDGTYFFHNPNIDPHNLYPIDELYAVAKDHEAPVASTHNDKETK